MFLFDFLIFYNAGRSVLAGLSPYTINGFISPYPLALLFAPFALLPLPVAYGFYLALNLFLLWRALRKRALWALLSFPVLFTLFVGQLDLALALGVSALPWLLPLALVKPQVGFVLAPWLLRRYSRRDWLKAAALGVGLLGLCFLLRPAWVSEWLATQPPAAEYSVRASNLYYLVPAGQMDLRLTLGYALAPLAFIAAFFLKERRASWALTHLLAPLSNIYSPAVLAEWIGPLEMLLSYLPVALVGGNIHAGMPMYLVGLVVFYKSWRASK